MDIGSAEEFFALSTTKATRCDIPGGIAVYVRKISVGERDNFEREQSVDQYANARARILVLGVSDPEGKPLFTRDDFGQINRMPSDIVEHIFEAVLRVNRMRPGDVEKTAGECEAGPSPATSTNSPSDLGG